MADRFKVISDEEILSKRDEFYETWWEEVDEARQNEPGIAEEYEQKLSKYIAQAQLTQTLEEVIAWLEENAFAKPTHVPQFGREPVIICLTQEDLAEFKATLKEVQG